MFLEEGLSEGLSELEEEGGALADALEVDSVGGLRAAAAVCERGERQPRPEGKEWSSLVVAVAAARRIRASRHGIVVHTRRREAVGACGEVGRIDRDGQLAPTVGITEEERRQLLRETNTHHQR